VISRDVFLILEELDVVKDYLGPSYAGGLKMAVSGHGYVTDSLGAVTGGLLLLLALLISGPKNQI
jgi:hypothetical protein